MLSYYKLSQTLNSIRLYLEGPTHTSMSQILCWSHEVNVPKLNPHRHTTDYTAWKQEQSLRVRVASSSDSRWTWEVCVWYLLPLWGSFQDSESALPCPSMHSEGHLLCMGVSSEQKRPCKPDHKPLTPHTHMTRGTRIESLWAKGHVLGEEKRSLWDDDRKSSEKT